MAITLDGSSLTVEKLTRIASQNEKVELHPDALERIKACRAMLEKKIEAREIMYGINTGIGEFSEVILDDDQVKQFQKYLMRCCNYHTFYEDHLNEKSSPSEGVLSDSISLKHL